MQKKCFKISKKRIFGVMLLMFMTFVAVLFTGCGGETPTVDITVNGQTVKNYQIYSGGEKIQFGFISNDNSYSNETADWSIESGHLDAQISKTGEFTSGIISGIINIKVSVTHKEKTITNSIPVTILARGLEGIAVKATPNTGYIEGQRFITDGIVIEGIFSNGTTAVVNGWEIENKDKVLNSDDTFMMVSYSENGVTKQTRIQITVAPKTLQGLSIAKHPLKLSYFAGEEFDPTGIELIANYEFLNAPVTEYTYDLHGPLLLSDKKVTFSYTENGITKTVTINLTVSLGTLLSIEITRQPDTTAYVEGQVFNPSGLEVTAHYEFISFVVTDFEVDIVTPLINTDTYVEVNYTKSGVTKSAIVLITMADYVLDSIEIVRPANKTEYSSGETLNVLGLSIIGYYTNGMSKPVTGWTVDKTNPLTLADNLVTITYKEGSGKNQVLKTITYAIVVSQRTLQSIEITKMPTKTSYITGEFFNTNGLEITAFYGDGITQIITGFTLSINRTLTAEDVQVIISYVENGIIRTAQINITVAERVLTGLEIVTQPAKKTYWTNERFSPSGLVIRAVYNDGAYVKAIASYIIDKANTPLTIADKFVVISFTENGITKSINIAIDVLPRTLNNITITNPAEKLIYTEGEYFDILGLSIAAEYSDAPSMIVFGWEYNLTNALTLGDTIVTISYTENGTTKTITFAITINPVLTIETNIQTVINVINALPNVENLTINDEVAVIYAGELYTALTIEQKDKVTNSSKLNLLLDRLIELKAMQPQKPEEEYIISYGFYNDLEFADVSFTEYPTLYKNSFGIIQLNAVESNVASNIGYEFIGWVDEEGTTVTSISNINSDKSFYAVFELTQTVNIIFKSYADKETILLSLNNVIRTNFDISVNDIGNTIFFEKDLLSLCFYVELYDGTVVLIENNSFATNYNAIITVFVVAVKTREITLASPFDAKITWIYEYQDDEGEMMSINKDDLVGTIFTVPVNASVTVYALNPLITAVKLNEQRVAFFQTTTHTFTLAADINILAITFEYFEPDDGITFITLTFSGINTKIFIYELNGWDGKLTVEDIEELAFVFDETNSNYINHYIINGETLFFSDLASYGFIKDTHITVSRIKNEFSLVFEYTNGTYRIDYLIGRQTIYDALPEKNIIILSAIFANLTVYTDIGRTNAITGTEIYNIIILDNITLYISRRIAFEIELNTVGGSILEKISVPASDTEFNLVSVLSEPAYEGHIFKGWALSEDGVVLSNTYLNIIIANINANVMLYAVWEEIEGYEPPVIVNYTGENFIGVWAIIYNVTYGIISAELTLNIDGTYIYKINLNGTLSVGIFGDYRVAGGKIEIKSLTMFGDYQMLQASDLKINIEWVSDNIIIASAFVRNNMTIYSYDHYLVKGHVKLVNYSNNDIIGSYIMLRNETENGTVKERQTTITLYANGKALIETQVKENGEMITNVSENALFRIASEGGIWILSNGSFQIIDVTTILNTMFLKTGQDYSAIINSSWVANDELSMSFAELIVFSDSGYATVYIGGKEQSVLLNIISANEFAATIQMEYGVVLLNIEIDEGTLNIIANDLYNNSTIFLKYIIVS